MRASNSNKVRPSLFFSKFRGGGFTPPGLFRTRLQVPDGTNEPARQSVDTYPYASVLIAGF